MAASGQVNDAYSSNVTDPDDLMTESTAQLLQKVETVEELQQQSFDVQNENTPKDIIEPSSHVQETSLSTTQEDGYIQHPTSLTPLSPLLPSAPLSLDTLTHQPPLTMNTSISSLPQSNIGPYLQPPTSPPPYMYTVPLHQPLDNNPPSFPQDLPPSYEVVFGSSSSSIFATDQSQFDLQDSQCRQSSTFHREIMLSCFVTLFCGVICGLFAFLLAKLAIERASQRRDHEARKMGKASLAFSISGIFVGLVILVIVAVTFGVNSPPSSSSYPYQTPSRTCYCRPDAYSYYDYYDCSRCVATTPAPSQCYCPSYAGGLSYYRSCSQCYTTTVSPTCYCQSYAYGPNAYRRCSECYYQSTTASPQCYCSTYLYGSSTWRNCALCYGATTTAAPCFCKDTYYGLYAYRPCSSCYQSTTPTTPRSTCRCQSFINEPISEMSCSQCYQYPPGYQSPGIGWCSKNSNPYGYYTCSSCYSCNCSPPTSYDTFTSTRNCSGYRANCRFTSQCSCNPLTSSQLNFESYCYSQIA